MALDDDFAGGPSYYNPSFGLMAIQQPEMFVQHLARNNIQPPPDFEEGFTHMDAHAAMGGKDQSRAPGMGEAPGMPQQGSFDERFSDANRGPPGMPFTAPSPASNASMPIPEPPPAPEAKSPGPKAVYDEPGRPKFGQFLNPFGIGDKPHQGLLGETTMRPNVGFPSSIPGHKSSGAAAEPLKKPDEKPTPAADIPATVSGATVPAGSTEEHPGGLNKEDPSKKTESAKEKKEDKGDAFDSFGKALAGVSSMKTPVPVFPHPGNLPHPSNQISRSTLPTELMKELSQIGHPGQLVRLGAALKGR